MIVASLDPVAGAVSMVSVPRDLVDLPLPDGRVFRQKVNGLVSYANRFPGKFPGATSGQAVLAAGLGKLLGVRIDGWAQVNLPGFVRVIDAIGGVDVTVRRALCDARYDEYGFTNGFAINPGRYHLNGEKALAYARIRKSARRERLHPGRTPGRDRHRRARPGRGWRLPDRSRPGSSMRWASWPRRRSTRR